MQAFKSFLNIYFFFSKFLFTYNVLFIYSDKLEINFN